MIALATRRVGERRAFDDDNRNERTMERRASRSHWSLSCSWFFCALVVLIHSRADAQQYEYSQLAPLPGLANGFASGIATSGNLAAIGSPYCEHSGIASGAVFIFEFDGSDWQPVTTLSPSDPSAGQRFGAAIAFDDDVLIVGAPGDDSQGTDAGAVYVFERQIPAWLEQDKILPSDGAEEDRFGIAVDIDDDGSGQYLLAIGADGQDTGAFNSGAAYLFSYPSGGPADMVDKILASDASLEDRFGRSLGLLNGQLLIGAWLRSEGATSSGCVYDYHYDGSSWIQYGKVLPDTAHPGDGFGYSIRATEHRLVVGAPFRDFAGSNSGSAYVFELDGSDWLQVAELTPTDSEAEARFGNALAIQGDRIAVGAWLRDTAGVVDSGSAYVFQFGHGVWDQTAQLATSDAQSGDFFGVAVTLTADFALVGAPSAHTTGVAYTFVLGNDEFRRGDCNGDGQHDVSDAIQGLELLFVAGTTSCPDACDSNDDGLFDISDAIHSLAALFGGGPAPTAPGPRCGVDPSDDSLDCAGYLGCN